MDTDEFTRKLKELKLKTFKRDERDCNERRV